MCLMCEEQELYDLYLEQLQRARRAANGELTAPNANWMWPRFTQPAPAEPAATVAPTAGTETSRFICDTPGE